MTIDMDEDLRKKTLGYLRSGAVHVTRVETTIDALEDARRIRIEANVQGHAKRHVVDGLLVVPNGPYPVRESWRCTCDRYLEPTCPHQAAVQMVTGGTTEARHAAPNFTESPSGAVWN